MDVSKGRLNIPIKKKMDMSKSCCVFSISKKMEISKKEFDVSRKKSGISKIGSMYTKNVE